MGLRVIGWPGGFAAQNNEARTGPGTTTFTPPISSDPERATADRAALLAGGDGPPLSAASSPPADGVANAPLATGDERPLFPGRLRHDHASWLVWSW